jgi:hypothetical protein
VVYNGKVRGFWGPRPSHGGVRATALEDPLPLPERRARFRGARRAKKFIEQELEANQAMIPQRIDNLKKTQDAAKRQQILPGNGVQLMTLAYEREGALAFEQFALVERDNVHFFYQYFKRTDEFMGTYAQWVLDMKRSGR